MEDEESDILDAKNSFNKYAKIYFKTESSEILK